MYIEAVALLTALLESTEEAIPMVQAAIELLGDAAQYHSSQRRRAIMQHLNPQLQALMKDDGSQSLLFGEDFGEKAKSKIEAAAALKKVVTPSGDKESRRVFAKATLKETAGPARVASPKYMAQPTD